MNALCGRGFYRTRSEIKKSKTGLYYCSRRCATISNNSHYKSGKNHPNYTTGKRSYRERALRAHRHKCSSKFCPIEEAGIEIPVELLDVDHKNRNKKDCDIENLQLLCVWCHAKRNRRA